MYELKMNRIRKVSVIAISYSVRFSLLFYWTGQCESLYEHEEQLYRLSRFSFYESTANEEGTEAYFYKFTMRKIILFFLPLLSLQLFSKDFTYEGLTYTVLDETAKTCMTKAGDYNGAGNKVANDLILKETVYDETTPYTLVSIGARAFWKCNNLKSITIPSSVTSIGESAFSGCTGLSAFYGQFASDDNKCLVVDNILVGFAPNGILEYVLPDNLTGVRVSEHIFKGLSTLTVPNSTKIPYGENFGLNEFEGTLIVNCDLPGGDGDETSGQFERAQMKEVVIGEDVTRIGMWSFAGCNNLTKFTVGRSVTSMDA